MTRDRFEVRLTRGATAHLEGLFDYLATTRSVDQGHELLDRLLEAVASLESFPGRGAVPKELDTLGIRDFRQILVPPYRLVYRIVEHAVFVAVIADGRRDMQALLERRLLAR